MGKGHISQRRTSPPALDENTVWAFRDLAKAQEDGRVFVTTTSRLLDFSWARDHLDYSIENHGDVSVIVVHAINCPVTGRQQVKPEQLQGIGFLIPSQWKREVRIVVEGYEGNVTSKREADPVHIDFDCVYIPWKRMSYPD